jgi:RimJ/RimL family protein N-acetyltransferase
MEIRKAGTGDLKQLLVLYRQARAFMAEHGNPDQWGKNYPPLELLERDIANGSSYVCMDRGEIVAAFFFQIGPDPTYLRIEGGNWLSDDPYYAVHRLASAAGNKGAATFCLDWCFKQCGNIRIDTHKNNVPMRNLLRKNGYFPCGIIYLENGDDRIAYQKVRSPNKAQGM